MKWYTIFCRVVTAVDNILTGIVCRVVPLCPTCLAVLVSHTHTHTHPFNGPLSGTTQVSQYQKGKTNLEFTEARDSEWQWHQLGHMQVCTSLQTGSHASTPQLSFLQAGCPSCQPTNSVKALKAFGNAATCFKIVDTFKYPTIK